MKWLFVVCTLALAPMVSAQMTPQQAFDAGNTFGNTVNPTAATGVSGQNGQANIPFYGTTMPESSYFQGGQGSLAGPRSQKVQDCANLPPSNDPKLKQQCDAVNMMADQGRYRPTVNMTRSDPLLVRGKLISSDPTSVAGAFTATYTACGTTTVGTPAVYEEFLCHIFQTTGETQCKQPRVVEVAADNHYQCTQSPAQENSYDCHRTLSVTVEITTNCAPGTWIHLATFPASSDQMQVQVLCEPNRNDGYATFMFNAWGGLGNCSGPPVVALPIRQPSPARVAGLTPHWNGSCREMDVWSMDGNCTGVFPNHVCSKTFYFSIPSKSPIGSGVFGFSGFGCTQQLCSEDPFTGAMVCSGSVDVCAPFQPNNTPNPYFSGFLAGIAPSWHFPETGPTPTEHWNDACTAFSSRL